MDRPSPITSTNSPFYRLKEIDAKNPKGEVDHLLISRLSVCFPHSEAAFGLPLSFQTGK